jgi:DNA-binding NtrC family response regulator
MEMKPLAGRSILLVEDEPLICLELENRLQAAGARVLAASHLEHALALANCAELSAGVLDFDLGKADSTPVCWRLFDRRIPFVFHSGRFYSAFKQWPSAPVVFKPAGQGLIATVTGLFR